MHETLNKTITLFVHLIVMTKTIKQNLTKHEMINYFQETIIMKEVHSLFRVVCKKRRNPRILKTTSL